MFRPGRLPNERYLKIGVFRRHMWTTPNNSKKILVFKNKCEISKTGQEAAVLRSLVNRNINPSKNLFLVTPNSKNISIINVNKTRKRRWHAKLKTIKTKVIKWIKLVINLMLVYSTSTLKNHSTEVRQHE